MQFRGRVLLRVVVRWVLPLLLLLLSVAIAAASVSSTAASSTAPVVCNSYFCAGGLGKGALQHIQGRHHRALFNLALLVLVGRRPVVVVSCCHLQSLGLELKLKLGGLGLRRRLMFTRDKRPTGTFHHSLLLA